MVANAEGFHSLPGSISRTEVELMLEQTLNPIQQELAAIKAHNSSWYGNGSGRKGFIERMEDTQNERWQEQKEFKEQMLAFKDQVLGALNKLNHAVKSGASTTTAVQKDRKAWLKTGLVILGIAVDIYFRTHGK